MPTLCADCDNVHPASKPRGPRGWLCMANKRLPGGTFVDPTGWADKEPYMRCEGINGGACPSFTPKREPTE